MTGVADCPVCYNLVQEHVRILRRKLNELRIIIENIGDNPQAINDTDFRRKLLSVNELVVKLWQDAKKYTGKSSLYRLMPVKSHGIASNR